VVKFVLYFFFFFKAEDGIRDRNVTGVQTCALPICVGIITALNPHVGYEIASKVAKEALETGIQVREIILRDNILPEVVVDQILDPLEMTEPGIAGESLRTQKSKEQK